jgi:hypothetical protein
MKTQMVGVTDLVHNSECTLPQRLEHPKLPNPPLWLSVYVGLMNARSQCIQILQKDNCVSGEPGRPVDHSTRPSRPLRVNFPKKGSTEGANRKAVRSRRPLKQINVPGASLR